nr:hypothetical protein [Candidatus Methylomirabilis oxyfera]
MKRYRMETWSGVRSLALFGIATWLVLVTVMPLRAAEPPSQEKPPSEKVLEDEFLKLGTEKGIGDKDWMKFERQQIKFQIEQFIPPLLQSAFTGDAFVLPPNAFRVGFAARFAHINGDDFFDERGVLHEGVPSLDGRKNTVVFGNFNVDRTFLDFDLLYGFDLGVKYLHSFTLRVNIPVLHSDLNGFVHPNGIGPIDVVNEGSTFDIGDVSVFLKKKIIDQAVFPVGVAMVAGLSFPSGSNSEKFTNSGRVQVRMPDMSGLFPPGRNFLTNPITSKDLPLNMPIPLSLLGPGIATIPYPASSNNVFNRFSDDGRLPAIIQPGLGDVSASIGLFVTRQFLPGDFLVDFEESLPQAVRDLGRWPGRSAFHIGALHQFVQEKDGIDPGDVTTFFASYVKPVYKDYVALDLSFVGFRREQDSYRGTVIQPFATTTAAGEPAVVFREVSRQPFSGGTSGYLAPSLIISPDPQIRFTISPLVRVIEPELGPAPEFIFRAGLEVTF